MFLKPDCPGLAIIAEDIIRNHPEPGPYGRLAITGHTDFRNNHWQVATHFYRPMTFPHSIFRLLDIAHEWPQAIAATAAAPANSQIIRAFM